MHKGLSISWEHKTQVTQQARKIPIRAYVRIRVRVSLYKIEK
nr:MAG TPA: hypothetical protein [Caudoviricetes sp.]